MKNSIVARHAVKYIHALRHSETLDHGSVQHAVATTRASQELAFLRVLLSKTDPTMPPDVRDIIMHSLGAMDERPRSGGHRNCYAPKKNDGLIVFAVDKGWMEWGARYRDTRFAHVTESGARAAGHAAFFAYRRCRRAYVSEFAEGAEPDWEGPATVGCLLAQVREARGEPTYRPYALIEGGEVVWTIEKPGLVRQTRYGSEAKALLAALEEAE